MLNKTMDFQLKYHDMQPWSQRKDENIGKAFAFFSYHSI